LEHDAVGVGHAGVVLEMELHSSDKASALHIFSVHRPEIRVPVFRFVLFK
jgi:hypothetical protein